MLRTFTDLRKTYGMGSSCTVVRILQWFSSTYLVGIQLISSAVRTQWWNVPLTLSDSEGSFSLLMALMVSEKVSMSRWLQPERPDRKVAKSLKMAGQ